MSQAKINGLYHWHSDVLKLSIEMDPIRCIVARETRKFKIDIYYGIQISYRPSKFPILYKNF